MKIKQVIIVIITIYLLGFIYFSNNNNLKLIMNIILKLAINKTQIYL